MGFIAPCRFKSCLRHALVAFWLFLPGCGAGVITSEDVDPGEAVVIGVIAIVAVLYAFWVGLRK